jgi:hypothetical protein
VNVGSGLDKHVTPAHARVGHAVFNIDGYVSGLNEDETVMTGFVCDHQPARSERIVGDNDSGVAKQIQCFVLQPPFCNGYGQNIHAILDFGF